MTTVSVDEVNVGDRIRVTRKTGTEHNTSKGKTSFTTTKVNEGVVASVRVIVGNPSYKALLDENRMYLYEKTDELLDFPGDIEILERAPEPEPDEPSVGSIVTGVDLFKNEVFFRSGQLWESPGSDQFLSWYEVVNTVIGKIAVVREGWGE